MRANEKISMEDYFDFLLCHKETDLTIHQMNQIISMHGFRKIHKTRKCVVLDAMDTFELMDPSRSTLNENISSSSSSINLQDVIADLNELNWQECCVTSIKTLFSSQDKENHNNNFSDLQQSTNNTSKVSKSRVDSFAGGDGGAFSAASTSNLFRTTKPGSKRKRKIKPVLCLLPA